MPLSVHLNVAAIEDLNAAITEGLRADPGRGVEVGGILLGWVEYVPGPRPTIYVERFEAVESEHLRGSSYTLSPKDKKGLAKKLTRWSGRRKETVRPVGYFRSHTRRGLYLDNDDFSVIQTCFPEQNSVFLLVRPVAGASSVGGFFFWEDGDIRRESSYAEFPFDPVKLAQAEREAPREPAAPRVELPAAPARPVIALPPVAAPIRDIPRTQAWAAAERQIPRRAPLAWGHMATKAGLALLLLGSSFYGARAILGNRTSRHEAEIPRVAVALPVLPPSSTLPPSPTLRAPVAASAPVASTAPVDISAPAAPSAPAVRPAVATVESERPSPLVSKPKGSMTGTANRLTPPASPPPVKPPREVAPATGVAHRETTSRSVATTAETPPAQPMSEPPLLIAHTSPPPALASVPARLEPRPVPPVAYVTLEPAPVSKLGRFVGHIPGLRRLDKHKEGFVPARAIRQVTPAVPPSVPLAGEVPVDVRVTVSKRGNVAGIEVSSHSANRRLVKLATDAAQHWQFEPARVNDENVASEIILHFTFKGQTTAEP
jgi:TonB family protein